MIEKLIGDHFFLAGQGDVLSMEIDKNEKTLLFPNIITLRVIRKNNYKGVIPKISALIIKENA